MFKPQTFLFEIELNKDNYFIFYNNIQVERNIKLKKVTKTFLWHMNSQRKSIGMKSKYIVTFTLFFKKYKYYQKYINSSAI